MNKYAIDSHKMQYHLDRVQAWKQGLGGDVFPIYVEISPVGHCNHRCTFCAVDYIGYKNRALDYNILCDSLFTMSEHDVRSIMFAGEGEPMLHPDIASIVNYTKVKCGMDVSFTTNGTAMTQKFSDEAIPYISWIKISINAGDKESYAKVHRCSDKHWQLVWDNIAYAVHKRNNGLHKCNIGVQSVLLPENAHTMDSLAGHCKRVGVDYLVIKPYSHNPNSETREYEHIKYGEDYKEMLESLQSSYNSSTFEILTREESMKSWDSEDRGYDMCHSTPYFWAYIMATGDVYACSAHIGKEVFNLGNINESLFDHIWLGAKRKKLIEHMKTMDISVCRKNCRMDKVNRFLYDIKNPVEHKNFV